MGGEDPLVPVAEVRGKVAYAELRPLGPVSDLSPVPVVPDGGTPTSDVVATVTPQDLASDVPVEWGSMWTRTIDFCVEEGSNISDLPP